MLSSFPNLRILALRDLMNLDENSFIHFLRELVTTNLTLKRFDCSRFRLGDSAPMDENLEKLLERPMNDGGYAQLEELNLVYFGSIDRHRSHKGDMAERVFYLRRALGRSVESVKSATIRITCSIARPTPKFVSGYFPIGDKIPFRKLKTLHITIDCFPIWDIPFISASFHTVEEVWLGLPCPNLREEENFEQVAKNINKHFPLLRILKIFARDKIGRECTMQISDLEKIANTIVSLEKIEWVMRVYPLQEDKPPSLKKEFICNRTASSLVKFEDPEIWTPSVDEIKSRLADV
ncbi:hypothetical protein TWF694_003812 [Orbilia ellipsospora]|uniref:Uncharacterized protein n=1 Tax=Orbilia ellipsospora TaxID=2528407 RepID=A0AAV9WZC9_9PEZI